MKFYYDGVLICGAKTQKYKYAIVYPSSQERWVMHSRHCSLASAQTMFERIKRGMSFYDFKAHGRSFDGRRPVSHEKVPVLPGREYVRSGDCTADRD